MMHGVFARVARSTVAVFVFRAVSCLQAADMPATEPRWAASSDEASTSDRQVARWVRELGAASYSTRVLAERSLAGAGLAAKERLLEAVTHSDAEVRFRARRVLATVLDLDFQARLAAFIADVEGRFDHQLPQWDHYRRLVGDDLAARRLFAEMQTAEYAMLQSIESAPESAEPRVLACCERLQQTIRQSEPGTQHTVPIASVAAMLLAGSRADVDLDSRASLQVCNLTYSPFFNIAMVNGSSSQALRKLLAGWVARNPGSDTTAWHLNLTLGLRFNLDETLTPAIALLHGGAAREHVRQYAIMAIGMFGDESHIRLVEPLLSDDTLCQVGPAGRARLQTEIRDVALAALVLLTKQDPKAYGLPPLPANNLMLSHLSSIGFAEPEQRREALAKWHAWHLEHRPRAVP